MRPIEHAGIAAGGLHCRLSLDVPILALVPE